MQDLKNLTLDIKYNDVLKTNGEIRPIWVLLVDGGKVIVPELALQNFRYAGESLCDIWRKDLIFGKSVDARYVEELTNSFENIEFEGTDKEKAEEQKQQKKKQEKENDIPECFVPWS
ncbi:unnamed protein product [Rhizophagus irregularis]|nr:unnamed protein product [Rhizophagus irregularis]